MEKDKSKNIRFFANQLSNADRDINTVRNLKKLPMASLNIYNGSNQKHELLMQEGLREPLHDFLISYFEKEKQKIYGEISKVLKT